MSINTKKGNNGRVYYMVIANNDKKYLEKVEQENDIGVLIDNGPEFEHHAQAQANKATRIMDLITSFSFLNEDTFEKYIRLLLDLFESMCTQYGAPIGTN